MPVLRSANERRKLPHTKCTSQKLGVYIARRRSQVSQNIPISVCPASLLSLLSSSLSQAGVLHGRSCTLSLLEPRTPARTRSSFRPRSTRPSLRAPLHPSALLPLHLSSPLPVHPHAMTCHWSRSFTLHPASNSALQACRCPLSAAQCRGACPSLA